MLALIRKAILAYIRRNAIEKGRFTWLYRKFCSPMGEEWATYLKNRHVFYAQGERCSIQTNVLFTDPKHVRVGDNVHMTGCILFGHDGAVQMLKKMTGLRLDSVGKVDIKDNVFIGHQAIIMPGVTIGPKAIVAAGALVNRDVPPNSIVGGVPAKVIGTVDDYLQRQFELTEQLPWRDLLSPTDFSRASDELTAMRLKYFFESDAESTTP